MASRLLRFVLVRLILMIPLVFILLSFVFFIMRILPGYPAAALLGANVDESRLQLLRHTLGLDLPLPVQYVNYLRQIFTGDLGVVLTRDRTVQQTILTYLPNTIELAVAGIFLGSIMGILLGVLSAQAWSKKIAGLGYIGTQVGLSLPVFWIGLLLQMIFGVYLRVLPVTDLIGSTVPSRITGIYVIDSLLTLNLPALSGSLTHLVMPALSIAIIYMAPTAAMTRANFRRVSSEDYIVTQRAAGLPRFLVDYKYTLKNALLRVVTLIGLQFAGLVSGAVVVESIYNIPGIGSLLLTAITARDFNLIQGCVIYIGLVVSFTSLIADVVNGLIDPRIKH